MTTSTQLRAPSKAELIESALADAAMRSLESMCFLPTVECEPGVPLQDATSAFVRFSGDAVGWFHLAMTPEAARAAADNFFACPPDEMPPGSAALVAAELANVICGCFLSRYNEEGSFNIAPPELMAGDAPTDRVVSLHFELEDGSVSATLGFHDGNC